MSMPETFTLKVGEATPAAAGRPSAGPVYRSIYAKDGLMDLPQDIQSPWDLFSGAVKKYPTNRMVGQRQVTDGKAGEYVWQTYEEVCQKVMRIGSAIRSLGVEPACNSQGICYVPLYDTLGAKAVEFIMYHAEISIAFVQESKIKSILAVLPKCTAHLRAIVSFGDFASEMKAEAERLGVSCFSWEEFSSMGKQDYQLPNKRKEDICTIMYTSGTTGDPKGVIITNKAIVAGVMTTEHLLKETDKVDIRYLMEDVQVMKPTIFCGVPRVYDRIYTGINMKIQSGGMIARHLFQYAYNYKLANMRKGLKQHEASPFFDKIVFSKIKEGLGGRIRLMIAGAAPLPGQIEEFMRVTTCSVVVQGYGLTESCAGCFTSIANIFSMIGTVGPPVTTIEARLESVPEMGYDALSDTPRGEICLRGHTMFSGYYKRPSLTEEVFSDGWFHTGDIGEWQSNGTMKIIDRKKNIFKLSQGEYVAVEVLERAYLQSPLVASVWVYGNSFESFLVAVAVPERQALEEWAAANSKAGDFAELCADPKARSYVRDQLNQTGKKLGLRGFEMLKAVYLEPVPFSIEKDLVTPTFKLKRPQLLKYYKDPVDQMYKDAKEGRAAP
ncbi:Long chain acyl-CoA synthetase 2 [Zea mays]|uniref:4-coumarate--CoA ligase n=1 Tax=Zea mays TaxID=4577 RepID=A0A3L6F967_MAIZE|nr:Long chain acyl-CoA synthetase 2 [Zea mays]